MLCCHFLFRFSNHFYENYKKFLVYLIAGLNLAVNEQSEKFWYWINDKVSMGEYEKESGENGGVERIWESMDGGRMREFLVV